MTNANIKFFDNIGNKTGTAASVLRSAAELLEQTYAMGEINIFGESYNAQDVTELIDLARNRAAAMIDKAAIALRNGS